MRGPLDAFYRLFAMFWYMPWKYFLIALALWPLVFRIQIAGSHGTNRRRYMLMDELGVMSVLIMTSAWILVLSFGWDTDAGFIFGIASCLAILFSGLRIRWLWRSLIRMQTSTRG